MNYSERLNHVIPGGCHTYSRGDDQFPQNAPQILERGKGAYAYTPENEEYLDYGMACRAVTVGFAEPSICDAAIKQIWNGNNLTRPSLIELQTAEAMVDLIPSFDMVKFAKNGSTVTTAAVKIARGYTGRKYIARCFDHSFFSYDDWFIGDTPIKKGVPEEISKLTLNFRYNDINSLKNLFEKYPDQVSCVILEPAEFVAPKDNYLQKVKELCHKNGALFILDEMITGFRWHLQGAQTYYNVEPDLSTFGKGMANGFSIAALGGKRKFMEIGGIKKIGAERLFLVSTTHGAELSSLGACVETIKFYKEHNVVDHLWKYGQKLMDGMNNVARECGVAESFNVYGFPCSFNFVTKDKKGEASMGLRTLFVQEMMKEHIMMPYISVCYAHGEKEFEKTMDAFRKAMKIYSKGFSDGYEKYLVGPVMKPVFRQFN